MYQSAAFQQSTTSVESVDLEEPKTARAVVDDIDDDTRCVVAPAQWSVSHSHSRSLSVSTGPISSLPPELLIHILRHLHASRDLFHCLVVSREWCQCSVELLWHKPVFTKYETLAKMTRLLASPVQSFDYALFIRRLNFLSLGKFLKDDPFATIANCTRLERLTLVHCDHLTSATLTSVLPSFPTLVAVDLSGVSSTPDGAVVGLASSARRLQGINLTGCKQVSDAGILSLAENCPLLRRVKLSGLARITDDPISALAKACPLLLEIDLNNCVLITDTSIRDLWTYSTHMREMRLSHCVELTDAAFPSHISQDDGTNPFAASSQARHRVVHDDDLPPLIIQRSFEHLRMLDLTACALVTDDAISGIISHAPKIRNLILSKCSLLTDRAVETICTLGRHLHYLSLGHASKITDRSVRNLARSCTRLRYVDFANCTLLTDMSVFELAGLTKLRRIGLVRVNRLTDEAIYALARRHNTLERIHLSYCDQISVMAIHFLLQKLHKLTHLSLTGVPAFRQQELQQFCRDPPKEFNEQQQAAFCVYSGRGVAQLRSFLSELFDHITEMNGTDETEFEEDDSEPEPYQEEEGPDDADLDDLPNRIMQRLTIPAGMRTYTVIRNGVAVPVTVPYDANSPNHVLPAFRTQREPSQALRASSTVDPSPSPPVDETRSAGSGGSGAAFFRTYPDAGVASSSQSNGIRTPDLNYAEIGHGRGIHNQPPLNQRVPPQLHGMRRDAAHRPHHRSRAQQDDNASARQRGHAADGPSSSSNHRSRHQHDARPRPGSSESRPSVAHRTRAHHDASDRPAPRQRIALPAAHPSSSSSLTSGSHNASIPAFPYEEPESPTPSSPSPPPLLPAEQEASQGASSSSKPGKRGLRNTISNAIFGNGAGPGSASGSGSPTARHERRV